MNEQLEVATLSSKLDNNIYHQCFEEICKKPVEDFLPKEVDYTGLIDKKLNAEIIKFTAEYSENEIEIQRLVKVRAAEILSGELTGDVDFGLIDIYQLYYYFTDLIKSFKSSGTFENYLKEISQEKTSKIFKNNPSFRKWADEKFLFDEIVELQKSYARSDLESYSLELYPNTPGFKERLKKISLKMVASEKGLDWTNGFRLKSSTWSGEMFLTTGLLYEEHFMSDLQGMHATKVLLKAIEKPTSAESIQRTFQNFVDDPSYNLIFDEGLIYDLFIDYESMCKESIQDELYWASSALRNRAVENHFSKLKNIAKTMFGFDDPSLKNKFDKKVDALELIKSRSIQESKLFYTFYFNKLLTSQKKSIELLKRKNFKETVLYLYAYLSLLPTYNPEGETPESRRYEDSKFIRDLSLINLACKLNKDIQSTKGSFFSPEDNYLYLEMKSLRHFGDGIMTLAHELGHGISFLIKNDHLHSFEKKVKSKDWSKRTCINRYYSKSREGKDEGHQVEEDWADYFAVQLVKEYKKTGDYSWAGEKFECEFVKPHHLEPKNGNPMMPADYYGGVDTHSSNLFRIMAQEYYSQGKLGPICTGLAKKETRLLDKCE